MRSRTESCLLPGRRKSGSALRDLKHASSTTVARSRIYAPYVEHVPPDTTAAIFWLKKIGALAPAGMKILTASYDLDVAHRRLVEGRGDHLALHRALHVGDL
jgi:hypothetical protein